MKFIKNKKFILVLIILVFWGILGVTPRVLALELNWPAFPGGKSLNELENEGNLTLATMVEYFYRWGISLGGLAAFIALVLAGFQYLTSVGDESKMRNAKDRITSAITGLILLLSSFLVLNVINPELTTLKMPSLAPPTDTLSVVSLTPPDISKPCEKAVIYSQPNYQTEIATINKNNQQNVWVSRSSGSIQVDGNCAVELYEYSGCSGEPIYPIYSSQPNISILYLNGDVQCINVK